MSTLVLKSSKRRKLFPKQARDASLSAFEALLWIFYVVCNKRCFVVCFITLQIRHEMFRFLINRLLNGETLEEETMAVVKLREREGQRVDLGRSLKGHL